MNTIHCIEQIISQFITHIQALYPLPPELLEAHTITINTQTQKQEFGDLSSNIALLLAKEQKSVPRSLAQTISNSFQHPFVEKIEIAGPGFLNIFLTATAFVQLVSDLAVYKEKFFIPALTQKKRYNVEFVSANPTGPLHLGHGRGGIIGDVLSNILHFVGHHVTREFYINDAGSQITKLGMSFKIRCQQVLGQIAELPEDAYHGEYLIELAQEAAAGYGPSLLEQPQTFFENYAKEHLLTALKRTLQKYGINFDIWFSEKSLHTSNAIERALILLEKNGFTYTQETTLWFKSTLFGDDKDRVVRRGNGELTYVAADIAYLQNKIDRGFDHLIMVLGQDHHSYVVRLKAALQALGHQPDQLDVILYQLVTLKKEGEAVRMSKRSGNIVGLEDIIDTVGCDVARFFYLHRKADAHLEFDIALALQRTEENPVYYIQYAFVRINSILEKAAQTRLYGDIAQVDAQYISPSDYMLIKKIVSLKQLLYDISRHYQTHLLTYYLVELAHAFHSYYAVHKVLDEAHPEQSRARLLLMQQLHLTFKTCMHLIGISTPQRM